MHTCIYLGHSTRTQQSIANHPLDSFSIWLKIGTSISTIETRIFPNFHPERPLPVPRGPYGDFAMLQMVVCINERNTFTYPNPYFWTMGKSLFGGMLANKNLPLKRNLFPAKSFEKIFFFEVTHCSQKFKETKIVLQKLREFRNTNHCPAHPNFF